GLTDQQKETTTHGSVGEERQVAILFVDIRGSTSFAESVPPFDVIHVLRRFYHPIETAVFDNGGHVACYTGDGLMALFGVEPSECAPLDAVRAGLDMLRCVKEAPCRMLQCFRELGRGPKARSVRRRINFDSVPLHREGNPRCLKYIPFSARKRCNRRKIDLIGVSEVP